MDVRYTCASVHYFRPTCPFFFRLVISMKYLFIYIYEVLAYLFLPLCLLYITALFFSYEFCFPLVCPCPSNGCIVSMHAHPLPPFRPFYSTSSSLVCGLYFKSVEVAYFEVSDRVVKACKYPSHLLSARGRVHQKLCGALVVTSTRSCSCRGRWVARLLFVLYSAIRVYHAFLLP